MIPEEKFSFDLEGYLVVKNVLNQDEVDELNELADEVFSNEEHGDNGQQRRKKPSLWGPAALRLVDHPSIVPYLLELLGSKFRVDHDYSIFMRQGAKGGGLHGGPLGGRGDEADHWYRYHDGVMRNGLTVFTYCLSPAQAGDGGFACIPGSHKSNFVVNIPAEVRSMERPAHYVRQPAAEAGDLIIFTEALVHGTMAWTAAHERRALLYKYSPGHSSWADTYYDLDDYPDLTEQQRRIMAPPSIGRRSASIQAEA